MRRRTSYGILMAGFILVGGKLVLLVKLKNKDLDFKSFLTNSFIKDFLKAVKDKDTEL